MLTYRYDEKLLSIQETANEDDFEFTIRLLQVQPAAERLKLVQETFEDNRVLTDVLFYRYPDHEYRIIVRRDYYADFIMELMKHRLLTGAEWKG